MLKKVLIGCAVLAVLALLLELMAFVHEKRSYSIFADYWKSQNKLPAQTGSLIYVALGDSTAQAVGTKNPHNGYVGLLASRIAQTTGKQVKIINLSVTGAKIQDVLDNQLPQLAAYKPDIVTIEIGANDIGPYDSNEFRDRFTKLIDQLPKATYISDIPYFGGIIRAEAKVNSANSNVHSLLATPNGQKLRPVELYKITRRTNSIRNFSSDLFHPSDRGYVNWADAYWEKIEPNLPQK